MAFTRAVQEDKPVFLSIGYATCHWCHVMAHESFEDPEVARLLNAHFIAVKVDREERPDVDSIYMDVCQRMTGQGGWPLTVILTPQKEPFFAGTYFPKSGRGGMTGLIDLLTRIISLWKDQQDSLRVSAGQVTSALRLTDSTLPQGSADIGLLSRGFEELAGRFDPDHGGFGRAPKFPSPLSLLFLLRFWTRTGSPEALHIVERTLDALRCGGIHDHLGGGFHRYSTDARWRIPHFEKMLYDQALLLMVFTEAWLATRNPDYRRTAEGIITYVFRDLSFPDGSFASAEDADSPSGEGAFYTWDRQEFEVVLGRDDGSFAADLFGITDAGNFRIPGSGRATNVLFLPSINPGEKNSPDPMGGRNIDRIDAVHRKLFTARTGRPRPPRDDKILTDWNALFIAALAQAHRAFGNPQYGVAAKKAMLFILEHLRDSEGGLLHRYCDGEAAIPAFADDYAFVIKALIQLYETSFNPVWLNEAVILDRHLEQHFHDPFLGGYFTSSDTAERILVRKKVIYDGAVPSGNSVILENLVHLWHLCGDHRYHERASSLAECFAGTVEQSPSEYTAFLSALDHLFGPATDIVIVSDDPNGNAQEMVTLIRQLYLPSVTLLYRCPGEGSAALDILAPFTRNMAMRDGKTTAYICEGTSCAEPVTRPEILLQRLGRKQGA